MGRRHLHAVDGRTDRLVPGARDQIMSAARQFLIELIDTDYGGTPVQFAHVFRSYGQLASGYGWPTVSEKTLSQCLCALGCGRTKIDRRSKSGGRLTYIEIPETLDAPLEIALRRAA